MQNTTMKTQDCWAAKFWKSDKNGAFLSQMSAQCYTVLNMALSQLCVAAIKFKMS